MKKLSHLNVGDFVAVPRGRFGDSLVPEYYLLRVTRKTNTSLFAVMPEDEKNEAQINQQTGKIKDTQNYAMAATPEIVEEHVKQTKEFERYQKAHKKYAEIIYPYGRSLSIEQLEILGEAWDRCKLLENVSKIV